jgi:hypothetical protein
MNYNYGKWYCMELNYSMKFGNYINMVFILKLEMNVKIINNTRVCWSSSGMLFYLTTL